MSTPSFDDILDEHRPRIVFGAGPTSRLEIAAREALTPIRVEIEKLRKDYAYASYHEANEIWEALDRIAAHVYPSEEL